MNSRDQQIEKYAKKCVHFTGMQHDKCDAGVVYKTITEGRKFNEFPCFGECPNLCDKFQAIGIDAAKKYFEEADAQFAAITLARNAITNKEGGNRSVTGAVSCPVCKSNLTLRYAIASNGHIHASCATPDCVRWME
jgi:hypothetical protein